MQLLLYTPDSSAESQVFSQKPFFSGRVFRTFYSYITVFSSKKPKQAENTLKNILPAEEEKTKNYQHHYYIPYRPPQNLKM